MTAPTVPSTTGSADAPKRRGLASVLSPDYARGETFRFLQLLVGLLAMLLPLAVVLADILVDEHRWLIRGSISIYYYTRGGGIFVGSLCAMAVFFLAYQVHPTPDRRFDNVLTNLAALCAAGVAMFPTSSDGAAATGGSQAIAMVHITFAGTLFGTLAIMALYHFTKQGPEDSRPGLGWRQVLSVAWRRATRNTEMRPDRSVLTEVKYADAVKKWWKNRLYRFCGWGIVVMIVCLVANAVWGWGWMFVFETVAVELFGISWLVKSDLLPQLQTSKERRRRRQLRAARGRNRDEYFARVDELRRQRDAAARADGGAHADAADWTDEEISLRAMEHLLDIEP